MPVRPCSSPNGAQGRSLNQRPEPAAQTCRRNDCSYPTAGGLGRSLRHGRGLARDFLRRAGRTSELSPEETTIGGFWRNDRFSYTQRFGSTGEVANRVLLEAGTASGREPTTVVKLRSYLGQFLEETKASLGADDEGRFPLRLLHFWRTFVEKMFAIHNKVEKAISIPEE